MRSESNLLAISESGSSEGEKIDNTIQSGRDEKKVVKMDAHGNAIFDSNSLKRKKGAITTFSPGPCVKSTSTIESTTTEVKFVENHNRNSPQTVSENLETHSSASIYRRTNQVVRPVISQRAKVDNNSIEDKNNNNINQMTSNNHLMRPNGSLSLNLNSVSSKVLASGTIRGAYVNIQDAAPLRNGPPVYSPPSPSKAAAIFAPQPNQVVHEEGKKRKDCPKIVDFTPKKEILTNGAAEKQHENIDPNMMRAHVKRSNSYRMAAIYSDPNDLSKLKESLTSKNARKSLLDSSDDEPYMNISKSVTRSFEKLIEEFSKSSSAIISTDVMLNESLKSPTNGYESDTVKRYSLEPPKLIDLNEYMTDSSFDDVTENLPKSPIIPLHIPSPSKVTLPSDSANHKARVLMKNLDTEIW